MEDEQDRIYVNMDGKKLSMYEDIEVYNSTVQVNDDEVYSTVETRDEENEDTDLISMIKSIVLEERLRDKNTIKQYHDEIIFLRNEISKKNDTIKALLELLKNIKHQKVETTSYDTCDTNKNYDEVIKANCSPANHRVIIDCIDELAEVNVAVFARNYDKNMSANTIDNDEVIQNSINDKAKSTISSESINIKGKSSLHSSEFDEDELFKDLYHQYVMFTKRGADNKINNDLHVIRRNKHNDYLLMEKNITTS